LLTVAPWTVWWRQNYFAELLPWLGQVMAGAAVHVIVVATGVVTAVAGVSDLRGVLQARFSRTERPAGQHAPEP
jgi:type II secretory pathway component PulM